MNFCGKIRAPQNPSAYWCILAFFELIIELTIWVVIVFEGVCEGGGVGVEGLEGADEGALLRPPPQPPLVGGPHKPGPTSTVRKLKYKNNKNSKNL